MIDLADLGAKAGTALAAVRRQGVRHARCPADGHRRQDTLPESNTATARFTSNRGSTTGSPAYRLRPFARNRHAHRTPRPYRGPDARSRLRPRRNSGSDRGPTEEVKVCSRRSTRPGEGFRANRRRVRDRRGTEDNRPAPPPWTATGKISLRRRVPFHRPASPRRRATSPS